ncbi:MAG: hypothetical protein M3Y58_22795 [Chloroflexota bacterium]|nr:hypothetical protein [Chloroflexota bacterium]
MTINHLGHLKPDQRNARKHNPRNIGMVEHSIQTDGFGRSILIDAEGNVLAGNGVTEAAGNVGLDDVIVVPSDGTKVIAIQRTDVQPGSERAIRLAIADNRGSDLSEFDPAVLAALADEVDLSAFWFDDELATLLADTVQPDETQWPEMNGATLHQVTIHYLDADEMLLKAFVGQDDDMPLEPIQAGREILERIRHLAAALAD